MNWRHLVIGAFLTCGLPAQTANHAVLAFVDREDANNVGVRLNVTGIGSSSDTSKVSGTMTVRVDLSAASATTGELTILSADAGGTDVNLSARGLAGNYNCDASNVRFTIATLLPPGVVNPLTGAFDASRHQATTTQGALTVTANTIAGPQNLNSNLADEPISGTGEGTGTIAVTPGRIEGRRLYFDLAVELPIAISENVPVPNTPIVAAFSFAGTVEAEGETFLEFPDYPAWAATLNLSPDSQNENDLHPDNPNFFLFALGFDAETAPASLFEISASEATLRTGAEIALADLEIQWSDDLVIWTKVPETAMITGSSGLTFGDPITVAPSIALTSSRKYLRLARPSTL